MKPALFLSVLSVETRKLMSYRVDFWLSAIFAFGVELAVAFFLWRAIFDSTGRERIGGFTFDGMVIYYVLAILLGRLARGRDLQLSISQDIYQGTLTRYLLYPSSYVGFKYAEHLGTLLPSLVQLAVFGSLSAAVLSLPAGLHITPLSVLMTVVSLAAANLLVFLLSYPVQGIAFWADNVWSLTVMVRLIAEVLGGLMLPLSLFPETLQRVLEWLPFAYVFYFPVLTLLGQVSPAEWLRGLAVVLLWCCVLAWVSRGIWRRGYRTYTGVGI